VLDVTERRLVLEALRPREDSEAVWEAFPHDLSGLHRSTLHDRFGRPCDG
jgi:hypothetical protein